ncbi:unnamed protein product [Closterium sp. Yama58-4]|nr:unnamed protein product [Closterium sp. Yama58-4]
MEESDAAVSVRVLKERLTWQPSAAASRGDRGSSSPAIEAQADTCTRATQTGQLVAETESNEAEGPPYNPPPPVPAARHAARRGVRRALPLAASSQAAGMRQDSGECSGLWVACLESLKTFLPRQTLKKKIPTLHGMLRDVVCDRLCLKSGCRELWVECFECLQTLFPSFPPLPTALHLPPLLPQVLQRVLADLLLRLLKAIPPHLFPPHPTPPTPRLPPPPAPLPTMCCSVCWLTCVHHPTPLFSHPIPPLPTALSPVSPHQVLQRALADLRASPHTPPFLTVHLDGRMHADDRAALKRGKQGILYLLLDLMHSADTHLAVIGISASQDADQLLEKRVRSRFSNRKIIFLPPQPQDLIRLLRSTLTLPAQKPPSLAFAPPNTTNPSHTTAAPPDTADSWPAFATGFNARVDSTFQHPSVLAVLLQSTAVNRTVPHIFKLGFRAVCEMVRRGGQTLSVSDFERAYASSTLPIRQQMLSVLELYLLVAFHRTEARAAAVAAGAAVAGSGGAGGAGAAGGATVEAATSGSHPINFHTAFKEYESRRVAARGSVSDVFSHESALQAYGRLIDANFVAVASGQAPASVEDLEFLPARLLVTAYELEEAINKNSRVPLELRNWLQQGLHEGAPVISTPPSLADDLPWRDTLKGFNSFLKALESSGASKLIDSYVASPFGARTGVTFLAPTDDAFAAMPPQDAEMLRTMPWAMASQMLFHVIKKRLTHVQLRAARPETKYGTLSNVAVVKVYAPILEFGPAGSPYGPQVSRANAYVGDSIAVHGITDVMDPGLYSRQFIRPLVQMKAVSDDPALAQARAHRGRVACESVLTALQKKGLSRFTEALQKAELQEYLCRKLETQELTLMVPSNDAWDHLPPAVTDSIADNPQSIIQVLLFHILETRFTGADLRSSAPGDEFPTASSHPLVRLAVPGVQFGRKGASYGAHLAAVDIISDEFVVPPLSPSSSALDLSRLSYALSAPDALGQSLEFKQDLSSPVQPVSSAPAIGGGLSVKQSLCQAVLRIVLENVQRDGHSREVQDSVSKHFATLPSRYALSVNPQRHEDVLLHMRLINEARTLNQTDPDLGPVVRVRRVCLGRAKSSGSAGGGNAAEFASSPRRRHSTDLSSNSPSGRSLEGSQKAAVSAAVAAASGSAASAGSSDSGLASGLAATGASGLPAAGASGAFPGTSGASGLSASGSQPQLHGSNPAPRRSIPCPGTLSRLIPQPTFGSSAPNCYSLSGLGSAGSSAVDLSQGAPTATGRKSGSLTGRSPFGSGSIGNAKGSSSHFSLAATLREGVPFSSASDLRGDAVGGGLGSAGGLGSGGGFLVGSRGSASSLGTDGDEDDSRSGGSSWHGPGGFEGAEGDGYVYGWEVSIAAPDRPGLLTWFTSALANSDLELNINEAHVFSTSDGMALQDFVVTTPKHHQSFYANEEELQDALTHVVRIKWRERDVKQASEQMQLANLRAVVEAMAYEDWAVDYHDLCIGERLGGGASGRLCRGTYRGQDVAVKVITLAAADDMAAPGGGLRGGPAGVGDAGMSVSMRSATALELLQCFKQEVAIMRMVRHKNLVQFIGACSHWPRLFIVTELMARGSVRDVLDQRGCGLPLPVALKILRDAARGLDFLHRRGIVHRDLKAANLLVDENDVVKLCDFGVARLLPSKQAGQLCGEPTAKSRPDMTAETGTYRWMAPEVMEHQPYDHRADIFSFGVTMWEVITGDLPYTGLTPLQAAIGVLQRNLRPPLPPGLPSRISSLITRCWAADPAVRPEFTEILSTLDSCLKGVSPSSLVIVVTSLWLAAVSASPQQRVKVYRLNDDGKWDDKGTGHVSVEYLERSDAIGLVVIDEEDNGTLLVHCISADDIYQRQEDTIISWTDPEVATDLALSFQESMGCSYIWEQICNVQRQVQVPPGTEGGGAGARDDVAIHEASPENALEAATDMSELPAVELRNLPVIAKMLTDVPLFHKDRIASLVLREGYVPKLLDLFRQCEDLENLDGLHHLYRIAKGLVLLNDTNLFDLLFADNAILDLVGALEYDPDLPSRQQHRKFLLEQVEYREAVPIQDPALRSKIHQTYRLGYIKDVILPRVLDDQTYGTFNSLILFNNVEVVSTLQGDKPFLTDLFSQLRSKDPSSPAFRDLVRFLQEFCSLHKHLQITQRNQSFSALIGLGLFEIVTTILQHTDASLRLCGTDILMSALSPDPAPLRTFLVEQPGHTLFSCLVKGMVERSQGEAGSHVQLLEILRQLLDTDTMDTAEKNKFLDVFYEEYVDVLVKGITTAAAAAAGGGGGGGAAGGGGGGGGGGGIAAGSPAPEVLASICDLLCFCVLHHSFRMKYYVLRNNVVEKVLRLVKRKERYLVVAAVRFLRSCISLKDDFYLRYLVKNRLFEPVIAAFRANGSRYNLLNSAVLDLVEFIRKENIKSLVTHLVETYGTWFDSVDYVDSFKLLRLKYEQNLESMRPAEEPSAAPPPSHLPRATAVSVQSGGDSWRHESGGGGPAGGEGGRSGEGVERGGRVRVEKRRVREERELEREEEDYFESGGDSDEDEPAAQEEEHDDSLPVLDPSGTPPLLRHKSRSPSPPRSLANGIVADPSRKPPFGLVDYEDEDDEDRPSPSSSPFPPSPRPSTGSPASGRAFEAREEARGEARGEARNGPKRSGSGGAGSGGKDGPSQGVQKKRKSSDGGGGFRRISGGKIVVGGKLGAMLARSALVKGGGSGGTVRGGGGGGEAGGRGEKGGGGDDKGRDERRGDGEERQQHKEERRREERERDKQDRVKEERDTEEKTRGEGGSEKAGEKGSSNGGPNRCSILPQILSFLLAESFLITEIISIAISQILPVAIA